MKQRKNKTTAGHITAVVLPLPVEAGNSLEVYIEYPKKNDARVSYISDSIGSTWINTKKTRIEEEWKTVIGQSGPNTVSVTFSGPTNAEVKVEERKQYANNKNKR